MTRRLDTRHPVEKCSKNIGFQVAAVGCCRMRLRACLRRGENPRFPARFAVFRELLKHALKMRRLSRCRCSNTSRTDDLKSAGIWNCRLGVAIDAAASARIRSPFDAHGLDVIHENAGTIPGIERRSA